MTKIKLSFNCLEGWVDNLNGVAGTLLLGALGIARTMEGIIDFVIEYRCL